MYGKWTYFIMSSQSLRNVSTAITVHKAMKASWIKKIQWVDKKGYALCCCELFFNSLVALLKGVNGHYFSFSSPENVEKVWGVLQRKTGLNPQCFSLTVPRRKFIDLWRSPLSNWKLKINKNPEKSEKTKKNSDFLMSVASLYTPCFVMLCVFLYGPVCHGANKLDLSTLFTTFFLWTSPPFILRII